MVIRKGEANMPKRCVINLTQIKSVVKGSVRELIGTLSEKRMNEVYEGLKMILDFPSGILV